MFSKSLFTALSLLVLTASSALGAPALSCPASSSGAVVAALSSSAAVSSTVTTSLSVVSSAAASATSASSTTKGKGKGKGGKGKGDNGKGGKGKGGAKGATTSSIVSSTEAVPTSSSAAATNIAIVSSPAASSAAASASSSSTNGGGSTGKGGDKGVAGAGAASSAVLSASVTAAPSSAATGTSTSGDDEQSATTLDPAVIATGFAQNGQQVPTAGQVASLTSTNNFINFCLTVNKPLTNGQQIKTGSCNPAPMGVIAATTNMPSSKFTFPTNFGTVKANTEFTVTMAVGNLATGNFVNEVSNYLSAPQQVNANGNIIGHSRIAIEQLDSLNQTTPTDPTKFAFFKGISGAAVNGVLSANIDDGLPAGSYRMASFNSAANLQPVLVAVAQHGSLDDMIYFTVE